MPTSYLLDSDVEQGITYIPDDPTIAVQRLLEEVASVRQSGLVALALRLLNDFSDQPGVKKFTESVNDFTALSPVERRRIVDHPAFLVWLRLAANETAPGHGDPSLLGNRLDDFNGLIERLATAGPFLSVGGGVEVRRHEVDPLITSVAPPTYDFADKQGDNSSYTLAFFRDVADVALDRIGQVWPALSEVFSTVVHTIIHVPDGDFRSASASRYTGVIFLTADDDTILSLEESIVHEFSHQLLYRVMEIDPLITNDSDTEFKLPWSGSERDYYGFFHAFYIYVVLAMYYGRVVEYRPTDALRAVERQSEILVGLEAAVPEILRAGQFTELGLKFTRQMCQNALDLVGAQRQGARV